MNGQEYWGEAKIIAQDKQRWRANAVMVSPIGRNRLSKNSERYTLQVTSP
jgi:hypothetical protein